MPGNVFSDMVKHSDRKYFCPAKVQDTLNNPIKIALIIDESLRGAYFRAESKLLRDKKS